jgi:hypothetical protein
MKKGRDKITATIKEVSAGVMICTMAMLLCLTDGLYGASPKDTQQQTVAPSYTQTSPSMSTASSRSSKVSQLLQQLLQAPTLKQYNDLLKNVILTPAEQEDLSKELGTLQHVSKLETLFQGANAEAEADARSITSQKKQELIQKQQQTLSQLNQQTRDHHQRQLSQLPAGAQAKVPAVSPLPVGPAVKGPISVEGLPHITTVSSPITPGRDNLGITGEDFRRPGEAAGRVSFSIGRVSTDLPIILYSSTSILAGMPAELIETARREMPVVAEGESGVIEGRVGVHTPRGSSVAVVQLNIPADESRLTPRIFSVFPKEIGPGQLVSIFGENFLSRERGSVEFHVGSRTIRAGITDWTSWAILAEMPADISGLRRTAMTVEVKNYLGRSDRYSEHVVTFIPVEETEELRGVLSHKCTGGRSWSGSELFFDFDLTNGWRVADRYFINYNGCAEVRRPILGSTNPRYEARGQCSSSVGFLGADMGGEFCMGIANVIIQGPKGLPYR